MSEQLDSTATGPDEVPEIAMSNLDMAKLLREQAGDGVKAVPGIEEMIVELTAKLHQSLISFTREDIEFRFSGMRMFDGLTEEQEEDLLKVRVNGEENSRIAAVLVSADPVRHVLAILLGGEKASINDFAEGPLRPSEASLFILFVDQIVDSLVDTVDVVASHGIPGAPSVSTKKEFRKFHEDSEFVALGFSLGFENELKSFELLVPLEFFDILKVSREEENHEEVELSDEEIWNKDLHSHVETLKIPMAVELSAFDVSLAKLGQMQIGQRLVVTPTEGGLRVLDEDWATAFVAQLEMDTGKFGLRVSSAARKEEA